MEITGDRSLALRRFFARYVTALGRAQDPRIEEAFALVRRETFAGPGPWSINIPGVGYVETRDDDIAFIYQDTLVALDAARGINIGQPSAHARWIGALALHEGDTILQVGVGTGYYTAILAHLVGRDGYVHAFEIDAELASRATKNLKDLPQVNVRAESGIADGLPDVDVMRWHNAAELGVAPCFEAERETGVSAARGRGRRRYVDDSKRRRTSALAREVHFTRRFHLLRRATG